METGTQQAVLCPRCGKQDTIALAVEGDLQRHQCNACGENFVTPALPPAIVPAPPAPPRVLTAYARIMPPEPAHYDGGVKGVCPKCGKKYMRLGQRYETHVATCDGNAPPVSSSHDEADEPAEIEERQAPVAEARPGPEVVRALGLSVQALQSRREILMAEVRSIDQAIGVLEKMRGRGGEPSGPFPSGG